MAQIFENNAQTIGKTPLVQIQKITKDSKARVLAKIEGRNPAFSVKCRIGAAMVEAAEQQGLLKPGMEIIEPTSGNTGIALAFVCAAKGYALTLTMPETMSVERRKVLAAFGAKLVLTEGAKGMNGAVAKATELRDLEPERFYLPQQFENPANPEIHFKTTGPEIWNDTDGQVDVIVAGVGTGGTISGIARYFKEFQKKAIEVIAVEPAESPVITQRRNGLAHQPAPHKIQGIGAGFIPGNLAMDLIDQVETVDSATAGEYARRLAREEGILAGISCGAAMAVADCLSRQEKYAGKTIVVILPDSGERYLSTWLYEGIV
jgi:cysteine synthase A